MRQTCRRLSSFREPSPLGELEETHWEDMDNDAPTDPAMLLEEIRKLSERLDALLDCKGIKSSNFPRSKNVDLLKIGKAVLCYISK